MGVRNGMAEKGHPPTSTIRDIADSLGLHTSTVSRAMNPGPGVRVSADTIKRVRAAAAAVGYVPNPWAASLRTKSTKLIGVVVPSMRDPIHAAVCDAVEQAAFRAGYQSTFVSSGDTLAGQRRKAEYLLERRVDGLILTDAHRRNPFVVGLKSRGVPVVLAIRQAENVPAVAVDELHGGALVARHLWKAGHRSFGVIGGMPHASTAHDRVRGFLDAIRALGGDVAQDVAVVASKFDVEAGYRACRQLMDRGTGMTALFAVSDLLAIGAMAALADADQGQARGVAVVGYNNLPLAARLPIPLSSVYVPLARLGRQAVAQLVGQLDGAGSSGLQEQVLLQPRLLVRESSRLTPG